MRVRVSWKPQATPPSYKKQTSDGPTPAEHSSSFATTIEWKREGGHGQPNVPHTQAYTKSGFFSTTKSIDATMRKRRPPPYALQDSASALESSKPSVGLLRWGKSGEGGSESCSGGTRVRLTAEAAKAATKGGSHSIQRRHQRKKKCGKRAPRERREGATRSRWECSGAWTSGTKGQGDAE